MLVEVDPPLVVGQGFGKAPRDVDQIILASRHEGFTLFPISEWPAYVACAIATTAPDETGRLSNHSVSVVDWSSLHQTYEDAKRHQISPGCRW